MIRVHVLVEGQTEETFVRDVLGPHLSGSGIHPTAKLITTKRTRSGPDHMGGISNYGKVRGEVLRLLGDTNAATVTTMIDFYGLPRDFPGADHVSSPGSCFDRVRRIEQAWADDIDHSRFLPYLSLHEFEALLLVEPDMLVSAVSEAVLSPSFRDTIDRCGLPETINEGKTTHPAARIQQAFPSFQKRLHGPVVARRTGLETIRRRCHHFDRWLQRIEALAG